MFETTLAGSLPKPSWLATPNVLWAPWTLTGAPLQEAKEDATALSIRRQEEAGIDIVSDGEQARQHFVHGFLAEVDGVDFDKKVRMGIRNNRYEADCPTVTAALKRRKFVHEREARVARASTTRKLKFTLPGPMTLIDTLADGHYGDRVKMAFAFADEVHDRRAHLLRLRHRGQHKVEGVAGRELAAVRGNLSGARSQQDPAGVAGVPQQPRAARADDAAQEQDAAGRRDRCCVGKDRHAGTSCRDSEACN